MSQEHEIIWCHCGQIMRPNYFTFIGYFKTGMWRGVQANPLNPSGSATVIKIKIKIKTMNNRHMMSAAFMPINEYGQK